MDLSLQQLAMLIGLVLAFAACGWAWDVMRRSGVSPWSAIARYVAVQIMSNRNAVPDAETIDWEQRSDAVEPRWEPSGTKAWDPVPDMIDQLGTIDDDALLDILAQLRDANGDYRFAESRIAKFIPGRVEDRLAQVRAMRDIPPPLSSGRQLRVKDDHGERLIPMDV